MNTGSDVLPAWTLLPAYVAMMSSTVAIPEVNDTEHWLLVGVIGESEHEPAGEPFRLKFTVPVGAVFIPAASVSVTVAVQLMLWLTC
jgi:hypothetical protein